LGKKVGLFLLMSVIYCLVGWGMFYFAMPSSAYPLGGFFAGLLIIWWIVSAAICIAYNEEWSHSAWFPIMGIIVFLITLIGGCEAFHAGDYSNLIGKFKEKKMTHWSQDIQPLDPTHIRLVPAELALTLANTALSQDGQTVGSQYPISSDYVTLQKIKGEYVYLIPLDFGGWNVWSSSDGVPGYIKVSATDPYAKPVYIGGKKLKYTPEACFGDNLERRLWHKYYNKILTDFSFEEDDNGHVYWVVTVASPSISFWGKTVEGIVLVDPETGTDQFVSMADLKSNRDYDWVDRVMPAHYISSYIDYWGELKDGWWNGIFTKKNLVKGETPIINYSRDGRCVFVTPITSTSDKDQSMTGLMYTDARTGEFLYYTMSGGATEGAIIEAVNNQVSFKKWHASEQMVYENIFGRLSALVPLLGENGNYQGLAIVDAENKRVAIGTEPAKALAEYQQLVASIGGQITTENRKDIADVLGKVERINWTLVNAGKQYYLKLFDLPRAFMISSGAEAELALTQVGDSVSLQYLVTDQMVLPTLSYHNLTLKLISSANEKAVVANMQQKKQATEVKKDVKDFKEKINDMDDNQVKELMKKTGKKPD